MAISATLAVLFDLDRAVATTETVDRYGRPTSTASAPGLLAAQADRLAIEPGMSVLEIGTGPGYFAAVLAELVGSEGRIVSVEIDPDVASAAASRLAACGYDNAQVVLGDGHRGAADHAPFDRVVASVGCADVAASWLEQLAPAGRALVPLLHGAYHPMVEVTPAGTGSVVMRSGYVAIQGEQAETRLWSLDRPPVEATTTTPLPDDVRALLHADATSIALTRAWDLAYWIALADEQAGQLAELNDGAGSRARIDAGDGVLVSGGPRGEELAGELRSYLEGWMATGAPSAEDYRHTFVRRGEATAASEPHEHRWVISRIDHDQIVELPER